MKKLLTALLITASATAMASDAEIKSKLQALGAKNIEVKDSPVKGLKTAVTDQGILYVSENGQYVLQGKMYELTNKGPVDVAGKFLADKVNAELEQPDVWNEPEKAQALGKERVSLEQVVDTIKNLEQGLEDVEGLLELAIEAEDTPEAQKCARKDQRFCF